MKAYDLAMLTRPADRSDPGCHGWCFGLPPGLRPEQWPLDPANGYPMQHGFTLLLPDDYRCHGPEIAALSFFASAIDHNDGGLIEDTSAIRAAMGGEDGEPDDPALLPFWRAERGAHPRLHRMEDILSTAFAVILLTREEFDGPLCRPPAPAIDARLDPLPPPRLMTVGAGSAFWETEYSPSLPLAKEGYHVFRALGEEPAPDPGWNRALRWTPRRDDPNAGIPPRETRFPLGQDTGGYRSHDYWLHDIVEKENYRVHDWSKDHAADHIGGTMRPVQNTPEISPYYVEFEEYLGGYNFGGGNAQLDFRDMKFDWACG